MKNSGDTIGNRTRDLLTCSAVPQPTAPPRSPKQWEKEMKLDTLNVRSLYRSGSLTTLARELARCKLDLVGAQEVRWDKGRTVRGEDYIFFYGKGNEDNKLGTGFVLYTTEYYQKLGE